MWIEGTADGTYRRRSLKTESWERAGEKKREIIQKPLKKDPVTATAFASYIADCEARNLKPVSLTKLKLIQKTFLAFADSKRLTLLNEVDAPVIRDFRSTWRVGPITAAKSSNGYVRYSAFSSRTIGS